MSLEKQSKKINKKEIESSKNIDSNSGKAAKGAFREFVDKHFNWRKSAIITGAAAISLSSMAQDNPNKRANDEFLNNKTPKTEWSYILPDGEIKYFNSEEEKSAFLKRSRLIEGDHSEGEVSQNRNRNQNQRQVENLGRKRYQYTHPNGRDKRYFDSMDDIKKLAEILGDKNYKERVLDMGDNTRGSESIKDMENKPIEGFMLYSRDFKVSQKFRSMTDLESFARSKGTPTDAKYIVVLYKDGSQQKADEISGGVESLRGKIGEGGNVRQSDNPGYTQNIQTPNTVNYRDFIDQLPEGKGKIIKENPDGTKEIIKIKKRRTRN